MMKTMIKTKIEIPCTHSRLIVRRGLMRSLDQGLNGKLTLLVAPAGYGKTTALSEWARQSDVATAWLSLDPQDNEWMSFWNGLNEAIHARVPDYGTSVRTLLNETADTGVSSGPIITAMLNELYSISHPLAIVLDDYHLIDQPDIKPSMSFLLERLPSNIHFYIASRFELALPTARLQAKGEMKRLSVQELRFQLSDGIALFRETTDLQLSQEQMASLCNHTEGWVSGLHLAALSLRSSDNIEESIRQFGGNQHRISDYLLEEVVGGLPEPLYAFLLETSILDHFNASLCEAVTGDSDSQERLDRLTHMNLFIVALDDSRKWYRYHSLLSEFMKQRFARAMPDRKLETHVRAARWLERHEFVEEAAEHYLAGQRYEDVVRLIETRLYDLINQKSATISRWVLQMPEPYLLNHPMVELLYLHVMVSMRRWNEVPIKVEQARIRYEAMQGHMDEFNWNALIGNIYILCATSAFIQRDLTRVKDYFVLADRYIHKDSFSHQIGRNSHYGVDEFDDHLGYLDNFHAAFDLLADLLEHWKEQENHPFAESMHASYSKLLYEWNRLDDAQAWIHPLVDPNRYSSNPRSLYHIYVSAARIRQALGQPERAIALLEELKLRIDSPDYSLFLRKIESEQASLSVRSGNIGYGVQWLDRCGMAPTDDVSLDSVIEQVNLARVLAACGRNEEALLLTERLHSLLVREGRLRDRIQILLVQSVTLHQSGQDTLALARLDTALRLAEPQGFIRSFMDDGAVMEVLLSSYLQAYSDADSSRLTGYVKELLRALQDEPSQSTPPMLAHLNNYGGLQVHPSVDGVEQVRWRTAKTEELMALLAHHRGEPVDRDQIVDGLWPDIDIDHAIKLLHTTVHYLRKNLQKAGIGNIVSFGRDGYRLDMTRLSTDEDTFRRLVLEGHPQQVEALKQYEEQLNQVYQTGYLAGKNYAWAEKHRDRMAEEYIRLLLRIHESYVQGHHLVEASDSLRMALSIDPLNEDIYERVIHVYLLSGNRIAAKQQYEHLRDMLQSEFDTEPREAITRSVLS